MEVEISLFLNSFFRFTSSAGGNFTNNLMKINLILFASRHFYNVKTPGGEAGTAIIGFPRQPEQEVGQ